ncbi:HK97 family phage prohead protease [Nereida sp. MMG025]|uniref:HK97 family phage prohead protease n=1 Tax=Nereida sp. MMG025 TaxID=2909981 RepID=UPI001EFFDFE1|nr:HK97 family phage prohead protease [Nereida sp. MMG025]MCF6443491.1 HK97 family phage prohead protease [Nereida sp. MMG025]
MTPLQRPLERKDCATALNLQARGGAGVSVAGYASLFGLPDQGGDIVAAGAYTRSLARLAQKGGTVRMLWQHDPAQPIGVWDEVREDARGLFVKGRLLMDVARAKEAAALLEAGAMDGLSIGYRTIKAGKDDKGRRLLSELELWEVSLVTFPMLPQARVAAKGHALDAPCAFTRALQDARTQLAT